jgi:hypothetical protein
MTIDPPSRGTGGGQPFPARIHVLLARDAPRAVVIRRGPARQVAVLGWDRRNDEFSVGQWLRGRIYERRCDLSPDGRHLIYFAMGTPRTPEMKATWTAISRAPYLKALAIWSKGDAWAGGGMFLSPDRYWLNRSCTEELLWDRTNLKQQTEYPWSEAYGVECPGVYYIRLQRDGWALKNARPGRGGTVTTFEKPIGGHWLLRKLAYATTLTKPGTGCYFDEHELVNSRTGDSRKHRDGEWADFDGQRLLFAEAGMLCSAGVGEEGLSDVVTLYDFTSLEFENLTAPY